MGDFFWGFGFGWLPRRGGPPRAWRGRPPPGGVRRAPPRPAEPMHRLATGSSPLSTFAVPDKRGRLLIPALRGLLKPAPDLVWAVRVLSVQRAALENTLD